MQLPRTTDLRIEAASAIDQGARARQEDALAMSFSVGSEIGFAVLSDGMGGHAAGDMASRIIVTEVFAELTLQLAKPELDPKAIPKLLRRSVKIANRCLRSHIEEQPEFHGMGGTIVVAVVIGADLHWISVGDSPLYLFRDRKLVRLNDDHSMAPQIDLMVREGLMDAEIGRNHPQRSCLMAALMGEEIVELDCPETPFRLRPDDLLVVASDGLQYLPDANIERVMDRFRRSNSLQIAGELLSGVAAVGDPEQDNTSLVVMKASGGLSRSHFRAIKQQNVFSRVWSNAISPVRHLIMRGG
jgi:protein phosphatase